MIDASTTDRPSPLTARAAPASGARRRAVYARCAVVAFAASLLALAPALPARSQALNLSHGGPITVTAKGGIEWRQKSQEVIATQDARAVRGTTTVTADELIAHYRKKPATSGSAPATAPSSSSPGNGALDGDNQIYLLDARGNVHIFTPTDQAVGDHAAYDMDQGVLVITGHALKLTTPTYVLTARDSLEYWSRQHMAVARGNAVLVTNTGRRIAADVLVAYTDASGASAQGAATVADRTTTGMKPAAVGANPPSDAVDPSGKLKRVDAIGHVVIMTTTDIVQGDRAVYDPTLGIARIAGSVHITRGQNVLVGDQALVNMKTGVSRLLSEGDTQVKGLIMPSQATQSGAGLPSAKPHTPAK